MFWLELIRSMSWSVCSKSHWQVWLWDWQKASVTDLHRGRITRYWWLSHTSMDFTSLEIRLLQHMRSFLSVEEVVSFQWVLRDFQYSLPTDAFICSPKAEHKEGSGAGLRGPSVPPTMARFTAAQDPFNFQHFPKATKDEGIWQWGWRLWKRSSLTLGLGGRKPGSCLMPWHSWILLKMRQVYTVICVPN